MRTALLVGGLPIANQIHRLKQQVQVSRCIVDILNSSVGRCIIRYILSQNISIQLNILILKETLTFTQQL